MNLNVNHEFLQSPIWNSRILFICCAGPCPSTVHTIAHIFQRSRSDSPLTFHPTPTYQRWPGEAFSTPLITIQTGTLLLHAGTYTNKPTGQQCEHCTCTQPSSVMARLPAKGEICNFHYVSFWNSRKEFTFRNSRFFGRYPRGYTRIIDLLLLSKFSNFGRYPRGCTHMMNECKCFRNFRTLVVTPGDTPTLSVSVKFSFVKSSFGRKANFYHLVSFPRGKLCPESIRTSWWLSILWTIYIHVFPHP